MRAIFQFSFTLFLISFGVAGLQKSFCIRIESRGNSQVQRFRKIMVNKPFQSMTDWIGRRHTFCQVGGYVNQVLVNENLDLAQKESKCF